MAYEEIKIGICTTGEDLRGWLRILRQEGLPHEITSQPVWPITVFSGTLPDWFESYVSDGGTAVVSGAPDAPDLLGPSVFSLIHRFVPPDVERSCYAPGMVRLFRGPGDGQCWLHENRKVRNGNAPDLFPAVLTHAMGAGRIVYTGIPLTLLLGAAGDCLRRFSPYTEVSERVASVDKAEVADTLVWMLMKAFRLAGVPYARPARYPNGTRSVFILRVDVDGAFGGQARRLADVAARYGVRASFFFNAARCQEDPGDLAVRSWPGDHEIGQHCYTHDVFEGMDANLENLRLGSQWVEHTLGVEPRSFVAPRGLWNEALDEALASMPYPYSSDFGLDFDSLPFRTPSGVLQIPVHPFSPERAFVYAEEHGLPAPTAEAIGGYYMSALRWQILRRRPAHFYGHPERLGAMAEQVLPPMFELAEAESLPILTLAEFCDWWTRRESTNMEMAFDPGTGKLRVSVLGSDDIPVEVFTGGRDCLVEMSGASYALTSSIEPVIIPG